MYVRTYLIEVEDVGLISGSIAFVAFDIDRDILEGSEAGHM